MNKELLRKVAAFFTANPDSVKTSVWVKFNGTCLWDVPSLKNALKGQNVSKEFWPESLQVCIGGAAIILSNSHLTTNHTELERLTEEILGLNRTQHTRLTISGHWPEEFRHRRDMAVYSQSPTETEAEVTIDYINWFIENADKFGEKLESA